MTRRHTVGDATGLGQDQRSVMERRSQLASIDASVLRSFILEERVGYRYSAPASNLRQRLRVVPPAAHGPQRCRRWQITVQGVPSWRRRTFVDRFGNLTVDFQVAQVDEEVEFLVRAETETDRSGWPYPPVADCGYSRPTGLTRLEGPLTDLAPLAAGGDVAAICDAAHRSLVYEWGITGVATTASEAVAGGRGVCQDYAHIMLALCRAAGIPARYVSGHLVGEGGSHAWVEVLRPHPHGGDHWLAEGWDPTHNRMTDADYLVVAVGRDYADVAPLSGTYEGPPASNNLRVDKRLVAS